MKGNRMPKLFLMLGLLAIPLLIGGCAVPEGGEEGGFDWTFLVIMVAIFALLYFLMIRPQRKKQKEHQQMTQELKRGDEVITIGGIIGVIDSIREDTVILKVESGATIKMARSSVAGKREEKPTF